MPIIATGPVKDHDPSVTKDAMVPHGPSWLQSEAWWFARTFTGLFVSVLFLRGLGKVFESGWASGEAYDRASELVFGRRPRPYKEPNGFSRVWGGTGPTPNGTTSSSTTGNGPTPNPQAEPPPFQSAAGLKAMFVKEVNGRKIFHHNEQINPDHMWPCPILNRYEACEACDFLVIDSTRMAWCAANEKLKQILAKQDDGSDLYELVRRLKAK